jgi:hypothetical protein
LRLAAATTSTEDPVKGNSPWAEEDQRKSYRCESKRIFVPSDKPLMQMNFHHRERHVDADSNSGNGSE